MSSIPIIYPKENYDFRNISLLHQVPVGKDTVQLNFKHFNYKGLLVQTPEITTKNGIVISGTTKKYGSTDLQFDVSDFSTITWFEDLEEHTAKLIWQQRENLFETGIKTTMADIQNLMKSITKTFRGGKKHLLNCDVPVNSSDGVMNVVVVDNDGKEILPTEFTADKKIIALIKIIGIKINPKQIVFCIEIAQIMISEDIEAIVSKTCLINRNPQPIEQPVAASIETVKSNTEVNATVTPYSQQLMDSLGMDSSKDGDDDDDDGDDDDGDYEKPALELDTNVEINLDDLLDGELDENGNITNANANATANAKPTASLEIEFDEFSSSDPITLTPPIVIYIQKYVQARELAKSALLEERKATEYKKNAYLAAKAILEKNNISIGEVKKHGFADDELDIEINKLK